MIAFGVSTTVEQDDRYSGIIFRCLTARFFAGLALQSRSTELHVIAEGLTATGDLGGHTSGSLHLPWTRIRELHFAPGGPGETGGLYAREGAQCSRCILPRITEPQAHQVIASIAHHFPLLMRCTETELESPVRLSASSRRGSTPGSTPALQFLSRKPTL